jgi:hypothetical protein
LKTLCQKSIDHEAFPILLYNLFETNEKSNDLMYWAINDELAGMTDPYAFFRSDTITTKLFVSLLFGDLGRKYLTTVITDTVTKIMELTSSLEVSNTESF